MTDRNNRFQDKVIVITGAGSGIGRVAALAFAREGGSVVIGDIDEAEGNETARMILDKGGFATAVRCDVRDAADVQALIARAVADFGGVDVLYNNAGVVRYGTVEELSVEDWDFQIDVNLKGTFLTCKFAIPQMRLRGGGAIVNTASAAGITSSPMNAAYSASKHGVVGLTKAGALEYAKDGIRINAVCPRLIYPTGMTEPPFKTDSEALAAAIEEVPLKRVGTPEQVGEAVAWLCSDAAGYTTGDTLVLDGGILSGGGGP